MIETKFKQTEAGVIPSDWTMVNLSNQCSIKARIGWQGLKSDEYLDSGDFYLITGTDFSGGFISWKTCHYVSKWRYEQDKNIQFRDGDILITKDGTIGKVAYIDKAPGQGTLNSGVFVIRPLHDNILPSFLQLVFKSLYFDNFISQITAGSTIVHLYQKDIVKFNFPIPPLSEQQRIAEALSDVDALISSLGKMIEKKRNIKLATMQQLLTGKQRLPGFTEPWVDKKVKELFEITRGYVLAMNEVVSQNIGAYKYPVYSSQTTNNGLAGYYNKFLFENCITWTTDGANAGDVHYRKGKFYCTNVCGVLRNTDGVANECIASIINLISRNYVSYVGNPKLMNNVMAEIPIHIPPTVTEQRTIANILTDMDNEIATIEARKKKYESIKQGMMQQLLTGKIRLTNK